jgi:hypothetical protein
MGPTIDIKTDWIWYSICNEQQNVILQRHFGKDSSKSIHQKEMRKTMGNLYICVM